MHKQALTFGSVELDGISTLVDYLMPNLFIHINEIYMICKYILLIFFSNEPEIIFPTIKWFQVLLCHSNNIA